MSSVSNAALRELVFGGRIYMRLQEDTGRSNAYHAEFLAHIVLNLIWLLNAAQNSGAWKEHLSGDGACVAPAPAGSHCISQAGWDQNCS